MKYLILGGLLVIFYSSQAQNIPLDNLFSLQRSELNDVNAFMIKNGWVFDSSIAETKEKMGSARWSYKKSTSNLTNAKGWLNLFYSPGSESAISYQVFDEAIYNAIKSRINDLSMTFLTSEITDEGLYSAYAGKNFVVSITSSSVKESTVPRFIFGIYNKQLYIDSIR